MKLQKLLMVVVILSTPRGRAMDVPEIGWHDLPATVVLQIIAQSPDKQDLVLVDKELSTLASKKNTKNLLQWPCVLSRKYHVECMVKYAKADDMSMMQWAIKSAPWCDHDDAVEVISYFCPAQVPELSVLAGYQKNPTQEGLDELLPCIMAVYKGSNELCNQYKNKYELDLQLRPHIQPLVLAAREDHRSVAELLLTQVEPCIKKIIHPSESGNFSISTVNSFLQAQEVGVEAVPIEGLCTPLQIAAFCNRLEMVKILLRYPCIDINAQDSDRSSAVMHAASEGYGEIVQYLINKGANVNIAMQSSFATPLHAVAGNGSVDILRMLLAVDPIIDPVDDNNETPLYVAVFNRNPTIVDLLLKAGADPNVPEKNAKITPLMKAMEKLDWDSMNHLLEAGALVNAQDKSGATALLRATEEDNYDEIVLLFKYNADPNIPNTLGKTPLHVAATNRNTEVMNLLLERGALINAQDKKGETSLMILVTWSNGLIPLRKNKKQTDMIYLPRKFTPLELLLKAGADPNIKNEEGNAALMWAVYDDNLALVDLLLQYGADPKIRNLKEKNAVDLATNSEMKKRFKDSDNCVIS